MSLTVARITLLTFLSWLISGPSHGQGQSLSLQKIILKSRDLQRNLSDYVNITKAKLVHVQLKKQDSLYHYQLSEIYFFDSVKSYSHLSWGRWGNCVLLFVSNKKSDLNEIISISDTCSLNNLIRYARPLLPNQTTITRLKNGYVLYETELVHGLTWEFMIKGNQELWLRTSDGFDSSYIPQPK